VRGGRKRVYGCVCIYNDRKQPRRRESGKVQIARFVIYYKGVGSTLSTQAINLCCPRSSATEVGRLAHDRGKSLRLSVTHVRPKRVGMESYVGCGNVGTEEKWRAWRPSFPSAIATWLDMAKVFALKAGKLYEDKFSSIRSRHYLQSEWTLSLVNHGSECAEAADTSTRSLRDLRDPAN
jgi:hypothetical protein